MHSPFRDKLPWRFMAIGMGLTTFLIFQPLGQFRLFLSAGAIFIFWLFHSLPLANTTETAVLFYFLTILSNALICFVIGLFIAMFRTPKPSNLSPSEETQNQK
jgi:hypothetical protein